MAGRTRRSRGGFQTVCYTVESKRIPREFDGYRIVQLSDLHGVVFGRENKRLIRGINEAKPELVVMTGDMVEHGEVSIDAMEKLCGRLSRRYPVFYVPGNHEQTWTQRGYTVLMMRLREAGAVVLENQCRVISRNGASVKLYGLVTPLPYYNDPLQKGYMRRIHFSSEDTGRFLGRADKTCYNILLAHNPLYYPSYRDWGADLTLSGHIHGGIIRIPGLGGLLSPDVTFFPKYDGGHFVEKGRHLIVSRGLGNHFLARILNPPELVVVTLKFLS